jgi:hypothetical protein
MYFDASKNVDQLSLISENKIKFKNNVATTEQILYYGKMWRKYQRTLSIFVT